LKSPLLIEPGPVLAHSSPQPECAVAISEKNADVVGRKIRNREIEFAVCVKVAGGDGTGLAAYIGGCTSLKRSIPIASRILTLFPP
jgi:hypothetical protein